MMVRIALAALLAMASLPASAGGLVEPRLHLRAVAASGPRVALTLDACGGATDGRVLSALIDNRIPATIFVTGIWLRRNRAALDILRAHPDLFQIENHGGRHVPAIDVPMHVYGLRAAGTPGAVIAEVRAGAAGIVAAGIAEPRWFRGATARYSASAVAEIRRLGVKVAGYSVNGDGGALLGAAAVERRIAAARDGDVILAHINQPGRAAGAGLVRGLIRLKASGVRFVRLKDADEDGSDGTTQ
ncbi:MAG: polysaccharide deacetylase family protein [Mesorhizobium sp.]|nr:polysaccharide deacetylase family protein [Mesorhizobium sp.]